MDKRIILVIVLAVVIGLAGLYFGSQPTGLVSLPEESSIRVGYKPNANYIALFVALENGYFEEENIKVETLRFDSTNTMMDAFAAGKIDATTTGNVIVSYSLENRTPGLFRTYSFAFYTDERHPENMVVRKGSEIKTYADLEGKRIGVNKGAFAQTMARKFFEKQGLENLEIIELGSSIQIPALETGQVDALLSLEPYPTIAVQKGIGEYLEGGSVYVKTVGFSPSFSGGVISTAYLEQQPVEAKKFLRAMEKAIEFIAENPEESKAILPKHVPLEEEIANKITFPEYYSFDSLSQEQKENIQKTADFLFDEGILSQRVNTAQLSLDSKYLQ